MTLVDNPHAGREHEFKVDRLASDLTVPVTLRGEKPIPVSGDAQADRRREGHSPPDDRLRQTKNRNGQ